jgi:hypothetical protein
MESLYDLKKSIQFSFTKVTPIGGGEDHVQSGNFKLGSWLGPEGAGMDEGAQAR